MYKISKLKNGLRLLSVPKKDSFSVNVLILAAVGANSEKPHENGLSHFMEHMCFKGTADRPRAIDISSELDSLGADYNAFTGREYTGFYISCVSDKLEKALEILADMYLNPLFDELEIAKERGVIKEEINLTKDTPGRKVQDLFNELMYGSTSFGRPVLGVSENLDKLDRRAFKKFQKKYYTTGNSLLCVSGNFDQTRLRRLAEKYFSKLEEGKGVLMPKLKKDISTGSHIKLETKDSGQSNLVMGFPTVGTKHPDYYPLLLASGVLGGTMSSRLFQIIREEMGAAYQVGATQSTYKDYGRLSVTAGIKSAEINEVISVILAETEKLKNTLVSEEELQRTKDSFIGSIFLGLETPEELGIYFGLQAIRGEDILSPQSFSEKIKKVTTEDIMTVAKKYFLKEYVYLAVIGPHKELSSFEERLSL